MAENWYGGATGGASSGSWYGGGGGGGSTVRRKKPSSGGFLGNLVGDVVTLGRESPYAIVGIGSAIGRDVYHHPWSLATGPIFALPVAEGLAATGHGAKSEVKKALVDPTIAQYRYTYGPLFRGHPGETGHRIHEHPLGPILDALAVASIGAGTIARGAAGLKAVGTEESVARALIRKPIGTPRTLEYGGLKVSVEQAHSPALRGAQRLLDAAQMRWPDPRFPGRVAFAAAGRFRTLPGRIGYELGEARRVRESIERAPAGALTARTKFLRTPQQLAIEAVAEGTTIDERIRYSQQQLGRYQQAKKAGAETDIDPKAHRKEIRLLEKARRYVDESGPAPQISADFPKLQRAYEETSALAWEGDAIRAPFIKGGAEAMGRRLHLVGRQMRGARFERHPAVKERREHIREYPGKEIARPRTEAEAKARLDALDAEYENLVRGVEEGFTGGQKADMSEVGRRNIENRFIRKSRRSQRNAGRPTVKAEIRDMAERAIYDSMKKAPDDPTVRRVAALVDERDALRALLNDPERVFGGATADFGTTYELGPGRRVRFAGREARPASQGFVGAEDFEGGQFRVPKTARGRGRSLGRHGGMGTGGSVGIPKKPGTFTHPYEGKVLARGSRRRRTTFLVAESYIEGQRFAALIRARDTFLEAATDTPQSRYDIPIRLDELKGKSMPEEVRNYMETYHNGGEISGEAAEAAGMAFESLRQRIFPPKIVAELDPVPGIKWIDRRLLGGLDKPNPLMGWRAHTGGRLALTGLDAINNASRAAILYLKPAYAIPNLLGNVALNLVQQGFAAPRNLRRAAIVNQHLSRKAVAVLDSSMGEGFAQALHTDVGVGRKTLNVMAGAWSAVVDRGFRRSAFLHEAHRAGYKSAEQLEDLLTNVAKRDELVAIAQRSNREIIDYGRLGPMEREVVRRIIFFYPWVKGSTVFATRWIRNHPVQAALLNRASQHASQLTDQELGDLPAFAQGIFPVGERGGNPLVVSPTSASILQTPADLARVALGLVTGDIRPGFDVASQFTPALSSAIPALTGRDPFSGYTYPPSRSPASIYFEQLTGALPQETLRQRLTGDQSGRLYPYSRRDALMQFLLGGVYPRPVDRGLLNERAAREQAAIDQDIPYGDVRLFRRSGGGGGSGGNWYGG